MHNRKAWICKPLFWGSTFKLCLCLFLCSSELHPWYAYDQTSTPHETPEQAWETKTHGTYLGEPKRQDTRAACRLGMKRVLWKCDFSSMGGCVVGSWMTQGHLSLSLPCQSPSFWTRVSPHPSDLVPTKPCSVQVSTTMASGLCLNCWQALCTSRHNDTFLT